MSAPGPVVFSNLKTMKQPIALEVLIEHLPTILGLKLSDSVKRDMHREYGEEVFKSLPPKTQSEFTMIRTQYGIFPSETAEVILRYTAEVVEQRMEEYENSIQYAAIVKLFGIECLEFVVKIKKDIEETQKALCKGSVGSEKEKALCYAAYCQYLAELYQVKVEEISPQINRVFDAHLREDSPLKKDKAGSEKKLS